MTTLKRTALATLLGTALVASPGVAHARPWGPFPRPFFGHRHFYGPGPLIGLGIAGAVLGTAAIVDSIVRPPVVVYSPPPPYPYDDAYRRGYERGRREAYDDDYRQRRYDDD
jgi:hypothetical protein